MSDSADLMIGTGRRFYMPVVIDDSRQYYDIQDATGTGIISSGLFDDEGEVVEEEEEGLRDALIECLEGRLECEEAFEIVQGDFCSTQTGLKLANGLEDATYFSTISGTVCIPDLTTGGCDSVTASLILYRNSGGNWFIKYYSAGISSNLRWAVRGPQDSDGNYSPVLGFLDAGQTGTFSVGETDWIEVPLTIWGQYRFNPVPTTVSGGFGSFAAEDDLIECP